MILFLKKGESVKPDHLIRDPVRAKEVSDGFGYKQNDLTAIWSEMGTWEDKNPSTMVGRIYVKAPVSSNMITTTVTVILITPLKSCIRLCDRKSTSPLT